MAPANLVDQIPLLGSPLKQFIYMLADMIGKMPVINKFAPLLTGGNICCRIMIFVIYFENSFY